MFYSALITIQFRA